MRKYKRIEPKKNINILLKIILFIVLVVSIFIYKLETIDSYNYINKSKNGDTEVYVVNNKNDSYIKYVISKDTEFESSRNYGMYKNSSLWVLGEKEKIGGRLVAETLLKNMYLPVYLWKDGEKTNLNFFQKIKSMIIEKKSGVSNYELEIDNIPNSVYINFSSPFINENTKIEVQDLTGEIGMIDKISKIIESLGGKITSNSKGYNPDLDCKVLGKKTEVQDVFKNIFECDIEYQESDHVVLILGSKFAERF